MFQWFVRSLKNGVNINCCVQARHLVLIDRDLVNTVASETDPQLIIVPIEQSHHAVSILEFLMRM